MRFLSLLPLVLLSACSGSVTWSLPKQTATEQLLYEVADENALKSLELSNVPRVATFIDTKYYTGDTFLKGAFAVDLWANNIPVVDNEKDATDEIILLSPVQSINQKSWYMGTPPIPVSAVFTFPSLALASKITNFGITQIQYVVFNIKTKKFVTQAKSKYGLSTFSVTNSLIVGSTQHHNIPEKDIQK